MKVVFRLSMNYTFEQFQHPRILTVDEFIYANTEGINRFTDDASDFDILAPPPAYFLLNASWRASIKKFEWHFQVKNILDTAYRNYTDRLRYFSDELGRNFILTLKYGFSTHHEYLSNEGQLKTYLLSNED